MEVKFKVSPEKLESFFLIFTKEEGEFTISEDGKSVVVRLGWYATQDLIKKLKEALIEALAKDARKDRVTVHKLLLKEKENNQEIVDEITILTGEVKRTLDIMHHKFFEWLQTSKIDSQSLPFLEERIEYFLEDWNKPLRSLKEVYALAQESWIPLPQQDDEEEEKGGDLD